MKLVLTFLIVLLMFGAFPQKARVGTCRQVSGTVLTSTGTPSALAPVHLYGNSELITATTTHGTYKFMCVDEFSFVRVQPSKPGKTYTPPYREFPVIFNVTGIDFTEN